MSSAALLSARRRELARLLARGKVALAGALASLWNLDGGAQRVGPTIPHA